MTDQAHVVSDILQHVQLNEIRRAYVLSGMEASPDGTGPVILLS